MLFTLLWKSAQDLRSLIIWLLCVKGCFEIHKSQLHQNPHRRWKDITRFPNQCFDSFVLSPGSVVLVVLVREVSNIKLGKYVFSCLSRTAQNVTLSLTHSVTFTFDIQRATLETCDLWDIWSEWWGNMTSPTFWQFSKKFWFVLKIS